MSQLNPTQQLIALIESYELAAILKSDTLVLATGYIANNPNRQSVTATINLAHLYTYSFTNPNNENPQTNPLLRIMYRLITQIAQDSNLHSQLSTWVHHNLTARRNHAH